MIKKIKHILNNNNKENHHHGNSTTSSTNSYEFTPTVLSKQMNLSHSKLNSTSPGNFLKKKIRSSKSWAKISSIPKQSRIFHRNNNETTSNNVTNNNQQEDDDDDENEENNQRGNNEDDESCAYESIAATAAANDEFERYIRLDTASKLQQQQPPIKPPPPPPTTTSKPAFVDTSSTGSFKSSNTFYQQFNTKSITPLMIMQAAAASNHSLPDTAAKSLIATSNLRSSSLSSSSDSASLHSSTLDGDLYARVLDKLARSSLDAPAIIPLLCVRSFSLNDAKCTQLVNRYNASGLNVRLIELAKGVPVVALFYLTCLDLIYVKTAEDIVGYVPRDCCRPVSVVSIGSSSSGIALNGSARLSMINSSDVALMPPPPPQPVSQSQPVSSTNEFYGGSHDFIPIRPNHFVYSGNNGLLNEAELVNVDRRVSSINEFQKSQQINYETEETNENKNQDDDEQQQEEEVATGDNDKSSVKYHSFWSDSAAALIAGSTSRQLQETDNSLIAPRPVNQQQQQMNHWSQDQWQARNEKDMLEDDTTNNTNTGGTSSSRGDRGDSGYQTTHSQYGGYSSMYESLANSNTKSQVAQQLQSASVVAPLPFSSSLLGMQSRSRLPISIRSNLNLSGASDHYSQQINPSSVVAANLAYKTTTEANGEFFKRNSARRSLDSSLAATAYGKSLYAVSIDMDEINTHSSVKTSVMNNNKIYLNQPKVTGTPTPSHKSSKTGDGEDNNNGIYPDLDLSKIELDCQFNDSNSTNMQQQQRPRQMTEEEPLDERNIWKVVLGHEARTFEELSVVPGMVVYVIKQFAEFLYVRLLGYENISMSQQYGLIPKYCALNLAQMIANRQQQQKNNSSVLNSSSSHDFMSSQRHDLVMRQIEAAKRRKSQITAL